MSGDTLTNTALWWVRSMAAVAIVLLALAGRPDEVVAFQCEDYFMDCTSFVECTEKWHDWCPMTGEECEGEIQCDITDECTESTYPVTMTCMEEQPN